jgi:hypothetical protein
MVRVEVSQTEKIKIIGDKQMKLWIDDVRPAPEGYIWCKSVNEAKQEIDHIEYINRRYRIFTSTGIEEEHEIELIDIDHDAGDFACDGGDYIRLLDWLEETGRNYPIRIHSMNPVVVANMRAIIQKNGWKEIR